jgi:hypothetical protein
MVMGLQTCEGLQQQLSRFTAPLLLLRNASAGAASVSKTLFRSTDRNARPLN